MARTRLMSRLHAAARNLAGVPSGPGLSRRDLVRLGLAAGVAPAVGCASGGGGKVVVIGAGIAGLHCAWRLVEAGVDVTVYEASDRAGGRMWSTAPGTFANGLLAEIGGELIDTNHLTLWELAEEFDIALDDRVAAMPAGMSLDTWYVNGRAVPDEEIVEQFTEVAPAFAAAFELAETTDSGYAALDLTSMADFFDRHLPPLRYPSLHAVLTSAYRGEFGLETHQQSALNVIYLIDAFTPDPFRIFGDSDERYHTHEGNETFPKRLAEAIGSSHIRYGHRLVAVRDLAGRYEVELVDGSGATVRDEADHVVFALPFTKLREVSLQVEALKPFKQKIIAELAYGTNAKIMGGFTRRPWWEDHNASGSLTSDLTIQQGWDSTIGQDGGGAGIWTNFTGGDFGAASGDLPEVEQFESILPDLDQIYPGSAAAFDGTVVRMHWPTFEHALGSYTCYTPGQWAFWSFEGRRNGNLHFCGEHTSLDFQGWMEGGAETGALVAAEILDDLGASRSEALARIVAAKTLLPQACYHGERLPLGMRPLARRRAATRLIERLLG